MVVVDNKMYDVFIINYLILSKTIIKKKHVLFEVDILLNIKEINLCMEK